ncbi:MAG: hypothetical protein LBS27_07865 [Bifidobacteriaceae bacterium]|jgi:hypothetical protein|nr:hypothetical protein [Bifidobacteriaceae bacterium]
MRFKKALAGFGCAALVVFGLAAPAEAALDDCWRTSSTAKLWASWDNASYVNMQYCTASSVPQYSSSYNDKASSIANRGWVWFVAWYKDASHRGASIELPPNYQYYNLANHGFNDVISSAEATHT